jgi:hypothetical protein
MKNKQTISAIMALIILTTAVPVYAFDLGIKTNLDSKIELNHKDGDKKYNDQNNDKDDDNDQSDSKKSRDQSHKEDDSKKMFSNSIKSWILNLGITGSVTAVSNSSLTVKTANNEIYTVTTTDANIRYSKNSSSPIVVGDMVYVIGIKNGTSIVASNIIVGRSNGEIQPNKDENRQATLGVITAKSENSINIITSNNISYVVSTTNAEIWVNKDKKATITNLIVGDKVLVQGDITGSSINAKKVMTIHLPDNMIIGKITAISGTTLTLTGSDNKVYTVVANNADIKIKGDKDAQVSGLSVGSNVIIKGDVNGSNVTASAITEGKIKVGFFHRFGLFFKSIFSKK